MVLEFADQLRVNVQSPFDRLSKRMDAILIDGGIRKEVVRAGEGPSVPNDASVLIHYSAFLEYSDQPFETTCHHRYPRMMKLGRDVTLAGMELGVLTMRKGEFSCFLFQPQYAFGEMGCPPTIPPLARVLYEVQILDFFDSAEVDSFVALGLEEQNCTPLPVLLRVVNTLRNFGNRLFSQSRHDIARDRYKQMFGSATWKVGYSYMTYMVDSIYGEFVVCPSQLTSHWLLQDYAGVPITVPFTLQDFNNNAITLLDNRLSEEHGDAVKPALLPLYLNMALTQLRMERPRKALKYGTLALGLDPDNTKALFRCGQAYLAMHDYENAQQSLIRAQAKKPFDKDINSLLRKVAMCHKDSMDKQKEVYSRMFKGLRSLGENVKKIH